MFDNRNAFNRFVNLDNVEWNVIRFLVNSESKYADYLWKILKYDTEDCLLKPSVTKKERWDLVYTNNGDASIKRVFMTPYIDDAWVEQSSHLHIYVSSLIPQNHLSSVLNIGIETIVHNKITNIIGDATDEESMQANPAEFNADGEPTILYKNRATVMLKCVLAALNGEFVNGVGNLQFNKELSNYDIAKQYLWNGRTFYGHSTVMSTLLSGVSDSSRCGY